MRDPFELELYVRQRHTDALREAALERLIRQARPAQPERKGGARRALVWLGARLIQWGSGLQRAGAPAAAQIPEAPRALAGGALTPA